MKSPLLIGLPGTTLTAEDEVRLQEIQPWGIILFARNYKSVVQIKQLIQAVKATIGEDTAIAVDHEGGRVVRFPEALPDLPAPRILGEERNLEKMCKLSRESGEALREWGITINLAPVVDVFLPNSHPRMRDRCFGSDLELVCEMAEAFIQGMHEAGIACTAKHFPGIGPAPHDTHERRTEVTLTREELNSLWLPFRLLAPRVDAIMVTHANYPSLDPDTPATFSHPIITQILRNEIGFAGKIISDDLEMGAISQNYTIQEATQKCLAAGCDIASICLDCDLQMRAYREFTRIKNHSSS